MKYGETIDAPQIDDPMASQCVRLAGFREDPTAPITLTTAMVRLQAPRPVDNRTAEPGQQ